MEEYLVTVSLKRSGLAPVNFTACVVGNEDLHAIEYTLRIAYADCRNMKLTYIVEKWCGKDGYKEIERYNWED